VIFVETPTFTRHVLRLLDDESYGSLQTCLAAQPNAGDVIRGGVGCERSVGRPRDTESAAVCG